MPPGLPDTRWRILTPTGTTGGIAIIHVDGEVEAVLGRLGMKAPAPGRVALQSIAGADRGLVARWSPRCVHLMPHGGRAVVREIADRLAAAGVSAAGEEDPRSLYPEAEDLIEARMLHALARAASPLAIDLLLDQPRRWSAFESGSGPAADADHSRRLSRLIEAPLVVMLGPANVGKSTLTNSLAGSAVSIVSEAPGTTRDHVGVMIDMAGLVVRLVDTPGLREAPGPEEAEAASIAMELASRADLLLLCGDTASAPPDGPFPAGETLRVRMRCDLGTASWPGDVAVSGLTGAGVATLVRAIRDRLVPPAAMADGRPWRFWAD
ncbi:MAG: 50S ribosome-binding GTPase [Phycisphaerales bacterium]|nr:50S ribosome-binding GTPase [Phycisphaerales bacterium]